MFEPRLTRDALSCVESPRCGSGGDFVLVFILEEIPHGFPAGRLGESEVALAQLFHKPNPHLGTAGLEQFSTDREFAADRKVPVPQAPRWAMTGTS